MIFCRTKFRKGDNTTVQLVQLARRHPFNMRMGHTSSEHQLQVLEAKARKYAKPTKYNRIYLCKNFWYRITMLVFFMVFHTFCTFSILDRMPSHFVTLYCTLETLQKMICSTISLIYD